MEEKIRLLFVDDEKKFLNNITSRLLMRDIDVSSFDDSIKALDAVERGAKFDVALLDLKIPGMDGEELLIRLKEHDPSMEVVILTGHGSVKSAASLTRSGAYEYLLKPCELDEVLMAITSAYAKRIKSRNSRKEEHVNNLMSRAVGMSPLRLLKELRRLEQE